MKTAATDLQEWLGRRREAVDAALERYLPATSDAPAQLTEAMRYSLLAGGKRLRPMLVLAAAEAIAEAEQTPLEAARCPGDARGMCCGVHTYVLARPRRPSGDGR